MGTRADFYAGKGVAAEWLGSIGWDGYRDGISKKVLEATTETEYRDEVTVFLQSRDDATYPKDGWPWPWDDSATSDCSYWFFDGQCWDAQGSPDVYIPCKEKEPEWGNDDEEELQDKWLRGREQIEFPNMADRKNVTFGHRSGLMIIGSR